MPRKKPPSHLYSVFVASYADEGTRARVERGEEFVTRPEQVRSESVHLSPSERQAGYAFYKAVRDGMRNPLVFAGEMWRDLEPMARVSIEPRRPL